jgi:hypothetical protein
MATFTKTVQTPLLAIQSVAASSVVISSAFDMSNKLGGIVSVRFGRRNASAAGLGVNIRIEASHATSGDNSWYPLAIFTSNATACEAEAVSGTVNAGTNVITVASTANLTAGDIIFIDNSTIANSEWARIKSIVSNTSITIEDNLVNAQTGSTIYDAAEIYFPVSIPEGVMRIRAVDDGSLFTQPHAINVSLMTIDGIS